MEHSGRCGLDGLKLRNQLRIAEKVVSAKITLEEWAKRRYEKPPNRDTLRRWARDLLIFPFPEKTGRTYYVDPNAQYRDHRRHGT